MKRRSFIKTIGTLSCGSVFLPHLISCSLQGRSVKFGLLTDLHYARRNKNGSRYYEDSLQKARMAVNEFRSKDLDFIIELGDLKDQGVKPDKKETLSFLDEIEETLQTSGKDVYHVLGNHDMDSLSKEDFLKHTSNPGAANGKNYYSFGKKGVRFLVLDANYNPDMSDYNCGNYDWKKALVPDHELKWLEKELQRGDEPVIIFTHQLLDCDSGLYKGLYIKNAREVNELLSASGRVLAVIQGHHHAGNYYYQNHIHYFTTPGMIEGAYPENNSFAMVEVCPNGDIIIDGFARCPDKVLKRNKDTQG